MYIFDKNIFMEKWTDIAGLENKYQVSNFGRVKGLERMVRNKHGHRRINAHILSPVLLPQGYLMVNLHGKNRMVHVLVAIAFLGHVPCGFERVINHKDFDKLNNHEDNLEITTNRKNSDQKHLPSSSEYVGVDWNKKSGKWCSRIYINGKRKYLGSFVNEYDAHLAYESELNKINLK